MHVSDIEQITCNAQRQNMCTSYYAEQSDMLKQNGGGLHLIIVNFEFKWHGARPQDTGFLSSKCL